MLKQSANSGISPWQGHAQGIYGPSPEGHSSHSSPEPEGLGAKAAATNALHVEAVPSPLHFPILFLSSCTSQHWLVTGRMH